MSADPPRDPDHSLEAVAETLSDLVTVLTERLALNDQAQRARNRMIERGKSWRDAAPWERSVVMEEIEREDNVARHVAPVVDLEEQAALAAIMRRFLEDDEAYVSVDEDGKGLVLDGRVRILSDLEGGIATAVRARAEVRRRQEPEQPRGQMPEVPTPGTWHPQPTTLSRRGDAWFDSMGAQWRYDGTRWVEVS